MQLSWFWEIEDKCCKSAPNGHPVPRLEIILNVNVNVMNQEMAPLTGWRPLLDWLYRRLISFFHVHPFIAFILVTVMSRFTICRCQSFNYMPDHSTLQHLWHSKPCKVPHDIFGTRRFWGLFFNLLAPFVGALCISTLRTGVAGLFDPTNCLSGTTSSLVYSSQIKFNLAPPMQILVHWRAFTWTSVLHSAFTYLLYFIINSFISEMLRCDLLKDLMSLASAENHLSSPGIKVRLNSLPWNSDVLRWHLCWQPCSWKTGSKFVKIVQPNLNSTGHIRYTDYTLLAWLNRLHYSSLLQHDTSIFSQPFPDVEICTFNCRMIMCWKILFWRSAKININQPPNTNDEFRIDRNSEFHHQISMKSRFDMFWPLKENGPWSFHGTAISWWRALASYPHLGVILILASGILTSVLHVSWCRKETTYGLDLVWYQGEWSLGVNYDFMKQETI